MNQHLTEPDDDPSLDAWLRDSPDDLPDDGFTEAVMQRIRMEAHAQRQGLPAEVALSQLHARVRTERRRVRWHLGGVALGAAVTAGTAWSQMDVAVTLAPAQALAFVLALAAVAWAVADGALLGV